jgi:hypothetical protein
MHHQAEQPLSQLLDGACLQIIEKTGVTDGGLVSQALAMALH